MFVQPPIKFVVAITIVAIFLALAAYGVYHEVAGNRYNHEREVFEKAYVEEVTAVYVRLSEWREGIHEITMDNNYVPMALAIRCQVLSDDLSILADYYESQSDELYLQDEQPYSPRVGFGTANSCLVEWLRQESKSYDLMSRAFATTGYRDSLVKELDQQDQVARQAKLAFWDYASSRMEIKQDDPYWTLYAKYSDTPVARIEANRRLGLAPLRGADRDAVMSYIWLLNFWQPPVDLVATIDHQGDRAARFIGYLDLLLGYWQGTDQYGVIRKVDSDLRVHFQRLSRGEQADPLLSTLYLRGEMSSLMISKEVLNFE